MQRVIIASAVLLLLAWLLWPREQPVSAPASTKPASAPAVPTQREEPPPRAPQQPTTPVSPAASRPYGFCPEPGEKLPPVQRTAFAATPQAKAAITALQKHDTVAAIAAFEQAPQEPSLHLQLGLLLSDTPRLRDARGHLQAYLETQPGDIGAQRMKARLDTQIELQSDHQQLVEGMLTLSAEQPSRDLLLAIDRALDEAAQLTGTTRRGPLSIVVYKDRSELLAVTCTPAWVGGVFDGTLRLLQGASDDVIRHESLHAQLSPLMSQEPKWFHEGLAQYFGDHGRFRWQNAYGLMTKNHTYIPFSSLAGSFFVFAGAQDAGLAYAQSLAMVHWLVAERGERVLAESVAYFRSNQPANGLFDHLQPGLDENALLRFLQSRQP